jgi:hypothetical protein
VCEASCLIYALKCAAVSAQRCGGYDYARMALAGHSHDYGELLLTCEESCLGLVGCKASTKVQRLNEDWHALRCQLMAGFALDVCVRAYGVDYALKRRGNNRHRTCCFSADH